ncbi:MAG: hypothetical protein HXO21_08205 [Prevotella sp.]|jgi:hypothetical protein|uniref:Uncharacterized protein n=2 Tax=Prevotella TaxID=838 RepID=A0A930N673_9BACT|nr:hypothetical protein [Prevotella jejuni]MBF1415560.1 hypothetical protein [Prevotella histicola]MBF1571347.1 hypothetical protein [Prevotella sp.]
MKGFCILASTYPMEVLKVVSNVDDLLKKPTIENIVGLTSELNKIVQQPVALNQAEDNQEDTIAQQAVARLEDVLGMLTTVI